MQILKPTCRTCGAPCGAECACASGFSPRRSAPNAGRSRGGESAVPLGLLNRLDEAGFVLVERGRRPAVFDEGVIAIARGGAMYFAAAPRPFGRARHGEQVPLPPAPDPGSGPGISAPRPDLGRLVPAPVPLDKIPVVPLEFDDGIVRLYDAVAGKWEGLGTKVHPQAVLSAAHVTWPRAPEEIKIDGALEAEFLCYSTAWVNNPTSDNPYDYVFAILPNPDALKGKTAWTLSAGPGSAPAHINATHKSGAQQITDGRCPGQGYHELAQSTLTKTLRYSGSCEYTPESGGPIGSGWSGAPLWRDGQRGKVIGNHIGIYQQQTGTRWGHIFTGAGVEYWMNAIEAAVG